MKINNVSILTVGVSIFALCSNSAFCTTGVVSTPPALPPIVFNALPPANPNQAAIDAAAQQAATDAAAAAAAQQAAQQAAAQQAVQQAATDAAAKAAADAAAQQATIDAAAKAAADAAAQQAAAVQKSVTDATTAVAAAQAALNGGAMDPVTKIQEPASMSTNATLVGILKNNAVAAVNKTDATTQYTAARDNIKIKVTAAADIIKNSFNTVTASAAAAPGNPDVVKALADITDVKKKSDEIVAAVDTDIDAALRAVNTKP